MSDADALEQMAELLEFTEKQKGLESTLTDPKKKYPDKVNALLSAWESVTVFISTSAQDASEVLVNWAYRHTLNLVLQGDWPRLTAATRTHLKVTLQRCVTILSNHSVAPKCRSLIALVNDPWGHPVLAGIINGATNVDDADVIAFCNSENGDVLSMRLEMLCESQCEDLALRLAEAILRCLRLTERKLDRNTDEHLLYIFEIYISLLFKYNKINKITNELMRFELKDGPLLIKRSLSKNGKSSRLWRQNHEVTHMLAHYFLTSAMIKPVNDVGSVLEELITEWILLFKNSPTAAQTLPNMIRKIIQQAASAMHIYAFCPVLVQQYGDAMKSFCIELYIRGLTTDMNELEQQKVKNDKAKVREAEVRLSDGFLKLADLMKDNVGVCRECVLTAFSLNPTESCYERIKEMAVASGKLKLPGRNHSENKDKEVVPNSSEGSCTKEESMISDNNNSEKDQDNNCMHEHEMTKENKSNVMVDTGQLIKCNTPKNSGRTSPLIPESAAVQMNRCNKHPPFDSAKGKSPGELCPECGEFTGIETSTTPKTESGVAKKARALDALILIKGTTVTESLNYDVLSAPNQVLDAETLGLAPQLCNDLAVVLSSPRYQMLSWVMDWPELKLMCESYLENVDDYRNVTKELKFLHIDYNQFKNLPTDEDEKDEYYGIEKGYEQWADLSSEEEYTLSKSRKRRARRIETTDSDSSIFPRTRRGRKANRLDSSESEYESNQRKGKSKRKTRCAASSSISDSDTGTQDSRTDSLGSDGYNLEKPSKNEKNGRNEKTSSRKRSLRSQKEVQHFAVVVNEHIKGEKKNDISKTDVMKLFAHIEESGNEKPSPQLAPLLQISSEKRASDPSVLKTLRMFRPRNLKKSSNDQLTQMIQNNHVIPQKDAVSKKQDDKTPYTKFAPMLSTIDLNPRIILTRTDITKQELKSIKGLAQNNKKPVNSMSQIKPDIICRKSPTKNMSFNIENNQFPANNGMGDVNVKHDYFKNDLLAKTVPGLNSLDMIVPPPSETTVQVVQLPRNTPSSSNNGQGNSHLPPKTSQASGNASNVNSGQDPDSSSSSREVSNSQASQSVSFSSLECPQASVPTADTGNATTHGQPKVSKLSTPVEVKYLTTTSEVNEILRSTLGDSAHPIQTMPLASPTVSHTLSLTKQRLTSRPEVKYRTSSTEVNEILRSTLGENAQVSTVSSASSSQHRISNVDFACQNKAKLSTRADVRYVTSSSEVNEIFRNTQAVQKTGQSPASLDTNVCANSVVQSSHQTINSRPVNPVSPFPVVKGVDLNVIASLISSKNCNNSVPPSPDSSSSGTTDSQMLQIVCQGRKINFKPLIFPHPGNRTAVTDQAVENVHSQISAPSTSAQSTVCSENEQQQHVIAHPIYEEEFPEFSQTAQTLDSSCKEKLSGKVQKPNSSPLASLPKFQQAFGKSIYNQTGSSSNIDNNNTQNTPIRTNEDISSETQNEAPQRNSDAPSQSQATVTSSSSSLSKAVQTTCIGSGISSQPPTSALAQQSPPNNGDVGSTLHVASAGQVFSILQSSPQIAVSAAGATIRVGAGMTVQAIHTSSGVIYMRPEATTLVSSGAGAALTNTVSTRRNQAIKTSPLSQTDETVQQSHLPETPNSVAVAIAPQTSSVLSRETVKRNRILAASLQNTSHKAVTLSNATSLTTNAISSPQMQDPEVCVVESSSDEEANNTGQQTIVSSSVSRAATQKSGTKQIGPSARQVRPILHIPGGNISRTSATNVTPSRQQSVQSVLVSPVSSASSAAAPVSTRLTQNVCGSDALITHSAIEPTVSSTTLEQLREFESVLEQVTNTSQMKERSTVQPQSQTQAQTQQHSLLTQQLLLTQAVTSSTSSSMEFTTCTSSQTTPTSYTQEIFPVASSATATSRVSVTYVTQAAAIRTSNLPPSSASVTATIGTVGKITSSPVVVVTSYCQSVASPTLSVTSQSSSSPCVTPAPVASTTSGKNPPKSSKSSKSKSVKSGTAATTSKASPVPKPQQKPQEDEQTAQRIYAILDEYAEQLRNSPDLNNKPAPRRRSNPPTNPNQSSKRKKSAQTKVKLLGHQSSSAAPEMSPGADDPRTLGSEDSSSGITQLSHIQDSPAPSSQNPDDTLSLRATPSLELTTDAGSLRGVVSEAGELGDNPKQQDQEHQDQNALVHESEQPEREQSPLQLQSSQSQAPSQQGILFTEDPLREDIFIQDRASGSDLQQKDESHNQGMAAPLVSESSVRGLMENGSEKPKQAERILHEQGGNENSSSSDSMDLTHGCCKVSGELNKKINSPRQNKHMLGVEGVNQTIAKSSLLRRTNNAQTFEYMSGSGSEVASYHIPSKVSNKLEYINDLPFQMSVGVQKPDSPWRYLPVVKRVKLAIQSPLVQKGDSEMTTDQMGSSLHLTDRDSTSELEDGSQDRRTYLSDAKFSSVNRKSSVATNTTSVSTNTINAYRKLENEAEEKRRAEKLERIDMQQRMVRMERELRLQKSLSEECEDLGVDEPSTSDLFPEADLLLDTNSSPSFDQTGPDASCSQSVGASESYPSSNFRPMEYSSSSQEGSRESPVNNPPTEDTAKKDLRPQGGLRKTYGDWKFRLLGKERNKGTLSSRGVGGKLGLLSSTVKSNSSIRSNKLTGSKNVSRSTPIMDERLNGNSKSAPPDSSSSLSHDSSSMASINTTNNAPEKDISNEKPLNGDSKDILSKVLMEKPLNVDNHMGEMTEESQDSGPKRPSHSTSSVANIGNVSTKTHLSVTSSSEDSVTLDAFTGNMVASPLDVTILSPVPEPLSMTSPSHLIDTSSSRDPLPSVTAAQKFTYTYGKKHSSNRPDVGRIITRSRLNRPNQYLSDHVDSQEPWDSSSSQDKTCADDEDSEMSPSSQLSSQVDDGEGNSEVDVVQISNDESSSSALGSVQSTMFPLLPGVITKVPISQSHEITFKSSTNGVDSVDDNPLTVGKRVRLKRTRSEMQFTQKNTLEANYVDVHTKEEDIKDSQKYDRRGLLREKRYKGFHSVSKVTVPMKQSSSSSTECNQRKQTVLQSKQHRLRELCEDSSADMFQLLHNPTSMTETDMLPSPEESSDNILTKVRLEGKEECSNEGTCGTHIKPLRSLRRKGYIRKCQCCNGSPERPKKKKHVAKVEKPIKKGQQPSKQIGKTNIVKKR